MLLPLSGSFPFFLVLIPTFPVHSPPFLSKSTHTHSHNNSLSLYIYNVMQYRSYYQFSNKLLSAFTHMSCDNYRTRFRSLLLCPLFVMFVESYIIIMISSTCFLILFRHKRTCNVKRESELHAFDMRFTLTYALRTDCLGAPLVFMYEYL